MKCKILRNIAGHPDLREGETCDVPRNLADDLVRRNLAVQLEKPKPPEVVKAVPPTPEVAKSHDDFSSDEPAKSSAIETKTDSPKSSESKQPLKQFTKKGK